MKLIIHGFHAKDGDYILCGRAAKKMVKAKVGSIALVTYDDGAEVTVKRNKRSISAWCVRPLKRNAAVSDTDLRTLDEQENK